MKALVTLARMLGVPAHQAEDALHSESAARAVLSRRNLFAAGAALAAGSVLVGGPLPLHVFHADEAWFVAHSWADFREVLMQHNDWYDEDEDLHETLDDSVQCDPNKVMGICWDPVRQELTDDTRHTKRLTMAEWAQREGRGYLCSRDF